MLLHIFRGNTLSFLSSSFLFLVVGSGQKKRLFPYLKPKEKAHIPNISLVQDGQDDNRQLDFSLAPAWSGTFLDLCPKLDLPVT